MMNKTAPIITLVAIEQLPIIAIGAVGICESIT
jgi:hypothetical protein